MPGLRLSGITSLPEPGDAAAAAAAGKEGKPFPPDCSCGL